MLAAFSRRRLPDGMNPGRPRSPLIDIPRYRSRGNAEVQPVLTEPCVNAKPGNEILAS